MKVSDENHGLSACVGKQDTQVLNLPVAGRPVERNEGVGRAQITVVLRDLVFENQVIPERIPGQVRHQPMVLMQVVAGMREDHVGPTAAGELVEAVLQFGAAYGK